jgi:predicted lipoprotein with Yx(FWY)xxD motif
MSTQYSRIRRASAFVVVALAALAVAAPLVAAGRTAVVVKTAKNAKLGRTILVTPRGMTLYHLSVERKGKFICVNRACLAVWHPLVVARGVKPAGAPALSTVRRPDGKLQVAFRGGPLYTFGLDRRRGDVNGEGFKDVGVWHAATLSASAPAPPPTTTGGGGYPYP